MELDNMHFRISTIDGYNKSFNFVMSARQDGKSTAFHIEKAVPGFFKRKRPTMVIRRMAADITEDYIEGIFKTIRKFREKPFKAKVARGDRDSSVRLLVDGVVMYYIMPLNVPVSRFKSVVVPPLEAILFDEFILNTRAGEKYLTQESYRFRELYNTFYRESDERLKCYFFGNPYSLYNPYFVDFGIDAAEVAHSFDRKPLTGGNWVVDYHSIKPELRQQILEKNPLYDFQENDYAYYALGAKAINDANIRLLDRCPPFFSMVFAIILDGRILGIFENQDYDAEPAYWVGKVDKIGNRRQVFCFDFKDLIERSVLIGRSERMALAPFKNALRMKSVAFQSIECDYFIEEVFSRL